MHFPSHRLTRDTQSTVQSSCSQAFHRGDPTPPARCAAHRAKLMSTKFKGPTLKPKMLLGRWGSNGSLPHLWEAPAPQCQSTRPQPPGGRSFSVLPSPQDHHRAGAQEGLGEAQPGRWKPLLGIGQWAPPTCLPGALQVTTPFPEPWGAQWVQGTSFQPLIPAPRGPFQPRAPGLILMHVHVPVPLILLNPTLLSPVTQNLRWKKRRHRLPGAAGLTQHQPAPGVLGRECAQPWLPARARCPRRSCQAMAMMATLPCALQNLSQGETPAETGWSRGSQGQVRQEPPGPQVAKRMPPPQAPIQDPGLL